jgi:hypothetical protein
MSALSVQVPFPVFQNSQGQPLEDGYVWIGQANLDPQVNPINVYWDAALTISAAQPIRTIGGYPSNSGTPARLYVNSDYSIRVMNKNGSVVYSAPVATDRVSADLVSYQPAGTGAVATTVQAKLRETVSVKDFGAVGDGVTDDTAALNNFLEQCRSHNVKGFLQSGTYLISSPLDISGVDIEGVLGGFNNSDGTIIKGSGGHILLTQLQTNTSNVTYSIKNLRLRNGSVGIRMSYAVHCRIENIFITDCTDGIYCGVSGILGPLWNNFKNCRVDVSGTSLVISGDTFANANVFETCVFKGGAFSTTVTAGGIGAIANHFINTEFMGDGIGVRLSQNKSTTFDNCYFENKAPAVNINGFTLDAALNNCTFGVLSNTNTIGVNSFIWHETATCKLSINGGYIYLASGDQYNNLRFVKSDNTPSFFLTMFDQPDQEILSTGWKLFDVGLPTLNDRIVFQESYIPTWTTSGTQPVLGNGTLTGRYVLSGRICTVHVELIAGLTTTFGTGQFQFSLPFAAFSGGLRPNGIGRISDTGTAFFVGLVEVGPGSSNAVLYSNNSPNLVQHNSPFTWASGDALRFSITYEI